MIENTLKSTSSLILISLLLMPGLASMAAEQDSLLRALDQLVRLEEGRGNMDLQLAEPLLQIAEEYRADGRFADAHAALDRGMQIIRVNHGLYAGEQLPYLEKKIENYADWGEWEEARTLLEHLMWLLRTKSRLIDEQLVTDLMDVSHFHLRGISEDSLEFQSYHFRRALSANWIAVGAGERLWSRTDRRLVPMLYNLVKQYHLQAVAISQGGRVGYELRQIVPGTDWIRERSEMRTYYYDTGMRIFNQLDDIFANPEAVDAEGQAMTRLYKADWQALFSRDALAVESYKMAYDGLLAADVSAESLNSYFASPSLLPESEFYSSVDGALTARAAHPAIAANTEPELGSALYFAEWSATFPYVRSPYRQQNGKQLESGFALFSLNLSGLTEISRWLSPRTVTQFGELLDATLLEAPGAGPPRQELRERLEWLEFRPRLVDGQPEQTSTTLLYQPAPAPQLVGL
jgi:hypothetical protein